MVVVKGEFPFQLGKVPSVGTRLTAENGIITFEGAGISAWADIPAGVLARITEGTKGVLQNPNGKEIQVEVIGIKADDPTTGVSGAVNMASTERQPIPEEWLGQDLLAILTLQTVDEESLIVATRALSVTATGEQIAKQQTDGSFTLIEVEELGEIGGQSAIRVPEGIELNEGDKVKVD